MRYRHNARLRLTGNLGNWIMHQSYEAFGSTRARLSNQGHSRSFKREGYRAVVPKRASTFSARCRVSADIRCRNQRRLVDRRSAHLFHDCRPVGSCVREGRPEHGSRIEAGNQPVLVQPTCLALGAALAPDIRVHTLANLHRGASGLVGSRPDGVDPGGRRPGDIHCRT